MMKKTKLNNGAKELNNDDMELNDEEMELNLKQISFNHCYFIIILFHLLLFFLSLLTREIKLSC